MLARAMYEAKDFQGAVVAYSKVIEGNPYDPDLLYERAISYVHLKKPKLALKDMDSAQNLQPKHPFRYSSRAYVKDMLGDVEGAIADYETALELDPEDAICHNNLGLLQEKLGRMQSANSHFKRADDLSKFFPGMEKNAPKEESPKPTPDPIPAEPPAKPKAGDYAKVMVDVFRSREQFKAFIAFVKGKIKRK